jgi:hypothetical protein
MKVASRVYVTKNCNLEHLADSIEERFSTQGYETQSTKTDQGWVVQARKKGMLRDILAADRAFTVAISGTPNNFIVSFGIGKWVQNIGMAAIEGFFIYPLIFFVEIPVSLWSFRIENQFWRYAESQVELRV